MATEQTRHEAADPRTSPARLQELTSDPELWPLIAANPGAYDSLVAWLGENGGEDVRRAVASRGAGAVPAPLPAGPPPHAPAGTASGSRGSTKGLWITLGVLVFLLLGGGVGAGAWALTKDDSSTTTDDDDETKTPDTEDTETDTKDDQEDQDEEDKDEEPADLDCDDLSDLQDAADDLTYYYPGIDDEEMLEEATAVIEQFEDYDDETITDVVEVLLTYAETIAEDEDAVVGPEWEDALDAKTELSDFVFEEC